MINQKEYEKLIALLYYTANQLEKWSQDGMVIDNIIVGESLYDDARLDAIDSRNEKRKRDATKDRIAAKKIKSYAKRKAEMLRASKKNKSK
jgi:IS5 family transposase